MDGTAMDTGPEAGLPRRTEVARDQDAACYLDEDAISQMLIDERLYMVRSTSFPLLRPAGLPCLAALALGEKKKKTHSHDVVSHAPLGVFQADSQYLATVQGNTIRPWMRQELCE